MQFAGTSLSISEVELLWAGQQIPSPRPSCARWQLKDWAQALGQHNQIGSEQTQGLCLWPPEEAFIRFLLVVEMRGYEQVSTGAIGQNLLLGWKDCGIWSQEPDALEYLSPWIT